MLTSIYLCKKLPQQTLSLKRFMLRAEALKLYRQVLRQAQQLPDTTQRREVREWTRADFEAHRHHQDEDTIKRLIMQGKQQLEELERTIKRTK